MSTNPGRNGTLQPGAWKTVMTGWGKYKLRYQAAGSAFPVEARFRPGGTRTLLNADAFDFSVIGYAELAFRSNRGGSYTIVPM